MRLVAEGLKDEKASGPPFTWWCKLSNSQMIATIGMCVIFSTTIRVLRRF